MSIPRRDESFTMRDLEKAGRKLLKAGRDYWEAAHKAGVDGAVIWLSADDGSFALFTRGEYRDQIMRNIPEIGPTRFFGATKVRT